MNYQNLINLGFSFETLPSGRINIIHPECFVLNGIMCTCASRGKWFRTLEVKSIDNACDYIKTLEFIRDFL